MKNVCLSGFFLSYFVFALYSSEQSSSNNSESSESTWSEGIIYRSLSSNRKRSVQVISIIPRSEVIQLLRNRAEFSQRSFLDEYINERAPWARGRSRRVVTPRFRSSSLSALKKSPVNLE